jgi:DNA polymerase III subunit epsilon
MLTNLTLHRPLAIIDLETTGVNPLTDRIVEIAILKVLPDQQVKKHNRRLNPGVPIPADATAIHGITDADVADAPPFEKVADKLLAYLAACDLCGFNLKRFDLQLLHNEFRRANRSFPIEGRALIDPLQIFHFYERRDLAAAVNFYLGREHISAHTAGGDVDATAEILNAMLARYPDLGNDVETLNAKFQDGNAVDSAGFFTRVAGQIRFARGKYRGQPLDFVARTARDYLEWMLAKDFNEDTKAIARDALRGRTSPTVN